jgi:hypothetical protein
MHYGGLTATVALAMTACGSTEPEFGVFDAQPVITTEQAAYTAVPIGPPGPYRQWQFTLVATPRNPSSRTLHVAKCLPTSTEPIYSVVTVPKSAEGSTYDGVWACVGHGKPIVLRPGGSPTDRLVIRGPNVWGSGSQSAQGTLSGRVQLVYIASGCRGFNPCGVESVKPTSNEFVISTVD